MPIIHETSTFTDSSSISQWATDSVKTMHKAGVIMGKEGNYFEPKSIATRAEVAAMLSRYLNK